METHEKPNLNLSSMREAMCFCNAGLCKKKVQVEVSSTEANQLKQIKQITSSVIWGT